MNSNNHITEEFKRIVLNSYRDIFVSDIFFIRALDKLEKNIPKKDFSVFCQKLYEGK